MEVNLLVNIASQVLPKMQPLSKISFYNEKSNVGDLHTCILNCCTYSRVTIEALYNLGHSMDYTLRFPALGKSMTEILQHLKTSRGRYFAAVPCAKEKEEKKIRQQNHQTNKKRYEQRQQYLDQYIKSVSS